MAYYVKFFPNLKDSLVSKRSYKYAYITYFNAKFIYVLFWNSQVYIILKGINIKITCSTEADVLGVLMFTDVVASSVGVAVTSPRTLVVPDVPATILAPKEGLVAVAALARGLKAEI